MPGDGIAGNGGHVFGGGVGGGVGGLFLLGGLCLRCGRFGGLLLCFFPLGALLLNVGEFGAVCGDKIGVYCRNKITAINSNTDRGESRDPLCVVLPCGSVQDIIRRGIIHSAGIWFGNINRLTVGDAVEHLAKLQAVGVFPLPALSVVCKDVGA